MADYPDITQSPAEYVLDTRLRFDYAQLKMKFSVHPINGSIRFKDFPDPMYLQDSVFGENGGSGPFVSMSLADKFRVIADDIEFAVGEFEIPEP